VVDTTMDFYGNVLQDLRAWKARPPKLKKPAKEPSEILEELPEPIAEAAQQARQEEGISQEQPGPERSA
jgi:ribosome-binding protein aMBF1 (putative translation factor)